MKTETPRAWEALGRQQVGPALGSPPPRPSLGPHFQFTGNQRAGVQVSRDGVQERHEMVNRAESHTAERPGAGSTMALHRPLARDEVRTAASLSWSQGH